MRYGCCRHEDIIYITGGLAGRGPSNHCYRLCVDNGVWEKLPPMKHARRVHAALISNNMMYCEKWLAYNVWFKIYEVIHEYDR